MYLRGTAGVIFVYDITDKDSLEILKKNLDLPILKESDLHNEINQ